MITINPYNEDSQENLEETTRKNMHSLKIDTLSQLERHEESCYEEYGQKREGGG